MTIEQFAAEQQLPVITRYTLSSGVHVYRLQKDKSDARVGLPVFALSSGDGWKLATPDETFVIMDAVYGTNE